jgi:uncharacterized protein (TIGR02596 family)
MNAKIKMNPRFRARAFSLIELLTVLAVVAMLMLFSVPLVTGVRQSTSLTNGAALLAGALDLARQTSLAQSREIEVRLYRIDGEYKAFQLVESDGTPVTPVNSLPRGIVLSEESAYSTILGADNTLQGKSKVGAHSAVDYKAILFRATGATHLDPSGTPGAGDEWFVTLHADQARSGEGRPADNFVTLRIDPITGRVQTFRL